MDEYYFKQIIFENLNYEISIEKAIYVMTKSEVPFFTKNNINNALNARLEIKSIPIINKL